MKQIFYHYTVWEDFLHGMYDENKEGRAGRVKLAASILSDTDLLYKAMKRVTDEWKHATEQNLSNPSINHQAFLGQAACCIYAGIHEDETREAWGTLTTEQRKAANLTADKVDYEWRLKRERNEVGFQYSLFEV